MHFYTRCVASVLIAFTLGWIALPAALAQTTFTVTNTNNSGAGSLRQAIQDANATTGADSIHFSISGDGPHTIQPQSALPQITDPVAIDGLTQTGADCTTWPATLQIELDGTATGTSADGLLVTAGNSTIQGLTINRFGADAIDLQDGGGNTIACNFLGTDPGGTVDLGNGQDGVDVKSANNVIGSANGVLGNLASGSNNQGVRLAEATATGNVVRGNRIGTDVTGQTALGNRFSGIIVDGAPDNTIGGATAAAGNIIAGNGDEGVQIIGPNATANTVQNNRIGTNTAGTAAIPNASDGVDLQDCTANVVADNVLSGNAGSGIDIEGGSDHTITSNVIGLTTTGASALGNDVDGLFIGGSSGNQIGGTAAGAGNTISANGVIGIEIDGSAAGGNVIEGNRIGTDATGTAALGNAEDGVLIDGAPDNTIGGPSEAAGNLISGNADDGIDVFGSDATGTLIQYNRIGVDGSGTGPLGNSEDGIDLNGSAAATDVLDNVISANADYGVAVQDSATGSVLERNFIGTDAGASEELGNGLGGVLAKNSGPATIGSADASDGNVIAFNDGPGVSVLVTASVSHHKGILGNTIYANAGLGIDLGGDGPTPNDPGDGDGENGANRLQNFPEIAGGADYDPETNQISLTYRVDSDPANSTYPIRVEFFRADADREEGKTFLGSDTYTESDFNDGPDKPIQFTPSVSVTNSDYIVATATDDEDNTSEFSVTARQLPVELAGFEATLDGEDTARLTWQTVSETNNAGFHIERRIDSDGSFEQIGFVDGTGTTTEAQRYRFADESIPFETERLTYRLRQVDTDGTATLSEETILEIMAPESVVLHGVFPHPVQAQATLRYELAETGPVRIELYDLLGRRVQTLVDGEQPAGRHETAIDAGGLPSGVYFSRLKAGDQIRTQQLVVQR